ncbi:FAD-binding protein [Pseudomonas sp. GT1P32]
MNDMIAVQLPDLEGRLCIDFATRQRLATDLGNILSEVPCAVLQPHSAHDIALVLTAAEQQGLSVTVRGLGRSVYGHTVVRPGGVLIDMSGLNKVHKVEQDRCIVDAGATWTSVIEATIAHGLTPPVLTDFVDLSVGGTLSWGGMGAMSFRHGLQVDNVLELEVITTDGKLHHCSPEKEADLFYAVLGGMGLVGVMTRVTLRLIAAPKWVRRLQIPYPDVATMQEDLLNLVKEQRVDAAEGLIVAPRGRWECLMEISIFHDTGEPDEEFALRGLHGAVGATSRIDSTYAEFVTRLGDVKTLACRPTETPHAHPWWSTMTSQNLSTDLIDQLVDNMDASKAGPFDLIVTYPVPTAVSRTPLPRVPDAEWLFVVAHFLCVDAADHVRIAETLSQNRQLFEQSAVAHPHGAVDPVSAVDYSKSEWKAHFGDVWPAFEAAKHKYDPQGTLDKARSVF